jgi:predicted chitinase
MAITREMLKAAEAGNTDAYYDSIVGAMNDYATAYAITTPLRIAHFLSQIAHESAFKVVEEKGSFSAKRMHEVFGCKGGPKNYDSATDDCKSGRLRDKLWTDQAQYANNAQNLLSYVYASRFGNGDDASGDGYRYRGRGMIQLTFKDNYAAFTTAHNQKNPADQRDFVANPDLLVSETKYGVESAFYFWDANRVNEKADADDVEAVTIAVNGGLNGLPDRKARLQKVKAVLGIG